MSNDRSALRATPLSPGFGVEIHGMDVAALSADQLAFLQDAILHHKVVVIRDQAHAGPRALLELSEMLGTPELEPHVTHLDHPDAPGVRVLRSDAATDAYGDNWHTDGATRTDPQWVTLLQAVDIPPIGRDTVFADMEAVFERLSPAMQAFLRPLRATHSWGIQKPDAAPVEHDLVYTDPTTGRDTLYVNRTYTRSIVGLTAEESAALLNCFYEMVHRAEVQVRLSWQPGTIMIWDNAKVQHYLVMDQPYPRVMHRTMVSGEPIRQPGLKTEGSRIAA